MHLTDWETVLWIADEELFHEQVRGFSSKKGRDTVENGGATEFDFLRTEIFFI